MRKFFVREDDFVKIINKSVKNIKKIEPIKTGWTNFVFLVKTAHKKLIFRFPRNDFFRQALIKEKNFCDFLKTQNLKIKTPNMKLLYENGKPFSVHDQIKGRPLNECKLSERKKKKLAEDICDFVKHLSVLNYPTKLSKSSKFLKDLSKVSGENYDLSKHACLHEIEKKDKVVLTHGDLNPGNILIRKGKLYAILDFAFVSYSSPTNDIARLVGRLDKSYKNYLLNSYEKKFNKKINKKELNNLISMWKYIEKKYVCYIKKNHPDIILPK